MFTQIPTEHALYAKSFKVFLASFLLLCLGPSLLLHCPGQSNEYVMIEQWDELVNVEIRSGIYIVDGVLEEDYRF